MDNKKVVFIVSGIVFFSIVTLLTAILIKNNIRNNNKEEQSFIITIINDNNLKFEYKVIVNEKEYDCLYHIVNYIPKCERPEDCPYIVSLTDWEKNSDGERVLKFNILELGPIIKK